MEFENYLIDKKIDSPEFRKAEPKVWADFNRLFLQMHPKSFTMQKLNLINGIRRKYPLQEESGTSETKTKVVVKPKTQTSAKPKMAKPKTAGKPVIKRPKIN